METEHPFSGNALGQVTARGELRLPPFILAVLARRGGAARILFGAQDGAPCLTVSGVGHLRALADDLERQRLLGASGAAQAARARRAFGLSEEAEVAADGRTALPPFLRRRAGIGAKVLFVGTGPTVEVWDAQAAREADDPTLREIAAYRLGLDEGRDEWA